MTNEQILQKAYDILSVNFKTGDCDEVDIYCAQCRFNHFLKEFKSMINHYEDLEKYER